jgi:Pro-kumamolisin, activation domain/Bacterial Ig domain
LKRLVLSLVILLVSAAVFAANPHKRNVDDNDTVVLYGNVHPLAAPQNDRGPVDSNQKLERMILVLKPRAGAKDSIDRLLAQLHDPSSPQYHQWLTPAEFGARFGIADDDLSEVQAWLTRGGFAIDEVGNGRGWINFSGTVGQVERAFKTQIHKFDVGGKLHTANAKDPSIPRALADVVGGVVTLHDFGRHPMNHGFTPVPEYTSGTSHYVAPADFAKIYNVNPLYGAGINGSGQTIAIVGRTDIALGDVQYFRSFFGLPANDPVFVHNGTAPGNLGGGEEGEADLDVEWSGAVAPNATIKFVISKSTSTTDGVDLSAQYIVNNNVAKVMSTSFGQCESSMGTSENNFYNNLWSQAATQGITSFVSSGDSGAAGCNGGNDTTGSGAAVSGLSSTPYNVGVGGTQFNDTSNPSAYWSSTNNSTDKSSALSYIPEIAWNESGNISGGSGLWSTGGGQSSIYAKPSWQVCVGVPATNARFVPDISLTAAGHDGYLVVQGHTSTVSGLGSVGGTSASSPSFAGLMALVNQKTAASWGNANTKFYSLANAQYASGGTVIFHDVTSGNNSVPGVTGFNCGTGYDAVTGVGTVDANSMVNNWTGAATPDFGISASPTSVSAAQGGNGTSTITTSVSGGFNNSISLSASGAPAGTTVSFSPASIAAPGSGSSTMTMTVGAGTAAGTYTITVTGTGGATSHSASVSLTVTAAGGALTNGGFETGSFSGWSTTGTAAVNTASKHGGTYGAQLGSTTPSLDSTAAQTFTLPSNATTLSFWYSNTCPDTVTYDWATATLKDNVTGTTATILAKTCTTTPVWTQVNASVASNAGHSVTLTLTSHDDNYAGDASFTYFDDVSVATSTPDTTAPTTSITAPANGATVSGTAISVTASASDNVGVTRVEFYLDGVLKSTDTTSPYAWTWDSTTAANGSHALVSKAYDAAGNIGTSATITVTVSNNTASQLLGNPGFESGNVTWTASSGVIDSSASEAAHSGSWKAWMDGYGSAHTDSIVQTVAIPAGKTSATLTFWLHIDSAETTTTTAYDTLKVQIRNSSGTVLATLATYSNLNKATGYAQKSFSLNSYIGQTIQVYLVGTEDASAQTSFVVDDFALNVQ